MDSGNVIDLCHGPIDLDQTVEYALGAVQAWLADSANSTETVIVCVKNDGDGPDSQIAALLPDIITTMGLPCWPTDNYTIPTLGQVRGNIVFLSRLSNNGQGFANCGIYFADPDEAPSVASLPAA